MTPAQRSAIIAEMKRVSGTTTLTTAMAGRLLDARLNPKSRLEVLIKEAAKPYSGYGGGYQ